MVSVEIVKGLRVVPMGMTIPLLARTHGQAASPTRMGKEITSFC
jgi:adenylosuccinate lyase